MREAVVREAVVREAVIEDVCHHTGDQPHQGGEDNKHPAERKIHCCSLHTAH